MPFSHFTCFTNNLIHACLKMFLLSYLLDFFLLRISSVKLLSFFRYKWFWQNLKKFLKNDSENTKNLSAITCIITTKALTKDKISLKIQRNFGRPEKDSYWRLPCAYFMYNNFTESRFFSSCFFILYLKWIWAHIFFPQSIQSWLQQKHI